MRGFNKPYDVCMKGNASEPSWLFLLGRIGASLGSAIESEFSRLAEFSSLSLEIQQSSDAMWAIGFDTLEACARLGERMNSRRPFERGVVIGFDWYPQNMVGSLRAADRWSAVVALEQRFETVEVVVPGEGGLVLPARLDPKNIALAAWSAAERQAIDGEVSRFGEKSARSL